MERGISGFTLKIIATLAMFIDHAGVALIEPLFIYPFITILGLSIPTMEIYEAFRAIGRIAFPIYCFLLVEGFLHTRDVKKYALRLFILSLISEIPFDLALFGGRIDFLNQNVFFTLLIGLLAMWGMDAVDKKFGENKISILLKIIIVALSSLVAYILRTDYSYMGVVAIILFYVLSKNKLQTMLAGFAGFYFEIDYPTVYLSLPLIYFYNGERGRDIKYFFYFFYPVHLLILYFIARLIY